MSSVVFHLRSRQILSSIDAANEQKQRNDIIRNVLLDSEDVLLQLHSKNFSAQLQSPIDTLRQEADANLKHFEENLSYSHCYKGCPIEKYWKDAGLTIDPATLTNLSDNTEVNTYISLEELRRILPYIPKEGALHERYELLLNRCNDLVQTARLDTYHWFAQNKSVLEAISSACQYCERHMEPVSVLDKRIGALADKCKELEEEEAGKDKWDAKANEGLIKQRINVMEDMSDLITQKLYLIKEIVEVIHDHNERIHSTENRTRTFIDEYRKRVIEQRDAIDKDLQTLARQTRWADSEARDKFARSKEASDSRLEENRRRSGEVWERIHILEKELDMLAIERRDEIDQRVKLVEREERREMEVLNFTTFIKTHSAALQTASRGCEAQQLLADMIEEMSLEACKVTSSTIDVSSNEILEVKKSSEEDHFNNFRKLYLLQGSLQFMKEQLLNRLKQRIEVVHNMQDIVSVPSASVMSGSSQTQYDLEEHDVKYQMDIISSELNMLRLKADTYVEGFAKTENVLSQKSCSHFEHPVQELMRINRKRRKKIILYRELAMIEGHPTTDVMVDIDGLDDCTTVSFPSVEGRSLDREGNSVEY